MDIKYIVNKYLNKKSENTLLDIFYTTDKQLDTCDIFKYIFKNKLITNKKLINDALLHAVETGSYLIAKTLLKYGKANPNLVCPSNFTLIDNACDLYYIKTAKVLYKYGAKGHIWCTDKKECEKYLKDFINVSEDREDDKDEKKISRKLSRNTNIKNNFNILDLKNIVIY